MDRPRRQPEPPTAPSEGAPAPARRRRRAAPAALALLLLVGGGLWWWLQGGRAPPPPIVRDDATPPAATAAPPAPPRGPETLQVVSVTGTVEHAGADGPWQALRPDDRVGAEERLQTGPGATARLAAGARGLLTLSELSQLRIRALTSEAHDFRLDRGQVEVDYQPEGDRRVRIGQASGEAAAEATAGRFHVTASGLAFAVATRTGTVSLTTAGGAVTVGAGEQALARPGKPPSAPRPIPTAVLLKVAEASRLAPPGHCLDTAGVAEPGAVVTVDGAPVAVAPDGRFPIRVVRRAAGGVEVRVLAPDGRVARRTVPCRAEADAAIKDFRVRWKNAGP